MLPCPRRRATYLLTITGFAFAAPAVPFQRLLVEANGSEVGRFLLNGLFKVECVLPWNVLAEANELSIRFRHPDAVRPCDVSGIDDHRWIAVGFQELTLSRPPAAALARSAGSAIPADRSGLVQSPGLRAFRRSCRAKP